jgi:diguanylate cyclase (GGDEF)-like protein
MGKYEEGLGLLEVAGETRVVAFQSLPDKGWLVGVDEPFDSASSTSESIKRFILLTCAVLALCIILSTAFFTAFLIKPYYRQRIELSYEIEAANKNLRKLHELSVGMQKHLELSQRMHDVLGAAREVVGVVGVDRLFIFMPDGEGKMLQCRSAVGNHDEPPERIRVPIGEAGGAVGRAYAYGETFKITQGFVPEHLRLEPPYSEIKALRSREFVALPLIVEDENVGVVTADNQLSKTPITAQKIDLLALFVNQAAVAIKNANMYDKLKEHADHMEVTDYLTKTYTYEHFRNLAKKALAKVEAAGDPLSMGALSLSNLAEFNRINGHNRGDKVLARVVALIKGHCGDDTVLGRCFGSTFGILFVGRDEAHARNVMARIVAEVSAQSYPGEEKLQQEKMRFTWGASQYDREGDKTLDGFISEVLLDTRPDRT